MKYKFPKALLVYFVVLILSGFLVSYKTDTLYKEYDVPSSSVSDEIDEELFVVMPEEINDPFEQITVSKAVRFLFYTYKTAQYKEFHESKLTDEDFYSYIFPYVPLDGERLISRGEYAVLLVKMLEFMKIAGVGNIMTFADINKVFYIYDTPESASYYESVKSLYGLGIAAGLDSDGGYRPEDILLGSSAKLMAQRLINPSLREKTQYPGNKRSATLPVEAVLQNPELPTGCEITSLTTVLNYMGFDADKCDMADNYLEKGAIGETNYINAFIGNPRDAGSYGCFAPVIVKAANKYLSEKGSSLRAYEATGGSLERLFIYIDKGYPVMIWGTIGLRASFISDFWHIDGAKIPWIANEHCMVLHGYDRDKNIVFIADPLEGNVEYDMEEFDVRFKELFMQSVVIK